MLNCIARQKLNIILSSQTKQLKGVLPKEHMCIFSSYTDQVVDVSTYKNVAQTRDGSEIYFVCHSYRMKVFVFFFCLKITVMKMALRSSCCFEYRPWNIQFEYVVWNYFLYTTLTDKCLTTPMEVVITLRRRTSAKRTPIVHVNHLLERSLFKNLFFAP